MRNISDHEAVLGTLEFEIDEVFASERKVYDFQKASWPELTQYLRDFDWSEAFRDGNVDTSAQRLLDTIVEGIDRFIPSRHLESNCVTPLEQRSVPRAIDSRLAAARTLRYTGLTHNIAPPCLCELFDRSNQDGHSGKKAELPRFVIQNIHVVTATADRKHIRTP